MIVSGEARPRSVKLLEVSGGIAQVVGDSAAGSFKEAEHPRDNTGKFATSAGGGSVSASNAPAPMTNHLKKIVSAAGFKKAKGAGPTTYVHPSGVKIFVHPTPGKIHSSKWSVNAPDAHHTGEGTSLSKVLAKLVPKPAAPAEAPKQELGVMYPEKPVTPATVTSANPSVSTWKQTAEAIGFEYIDEDAGDLMYMGDEVRLTINSETGEWLSQDVDTGDEVASGKDFESFKKAYAPNLKTEAAAPSQSQETEASKLEGLKSLGSGKAITDLGYEPVEFEDGTAIYQKPGFPQVKIKYNSKTTEWVAATPPHMTKEGSGLPALEALMKGSIQAGVKNSQQVIQTKAEAANQTAAQKAQAEAQAAQAAKANHYSKLMKQLQDTAPTPTATEQAAIASYSGSNYVNINTELRHNPDAASGNAKVKAIDAYLAKSTISVDCTLYRKVSGEYSKILKSVMMEGCSFIDRGFISTSTHEGTWHGDLQMRIKVPAGSKGAAIKSLSQHKSENEVLLPRNSRLIVTAMDLKTGVVEVTLDQGHLK